MTVCPRKIARIRTGGQSGVDRAALDFAIEHNIPYCGWCPKGGWAEDYPDPPGLLRDEGHSIPCNMINCFCMFSDYIPVTLDDWIRIDAGRRAKLNRQSN